MKPELHYINGEWMSKSKILHTFCVSQNPLDRKIKETCGNDELLEDWLNSKQTKESRQPEKIMKIRLHYINGEWMSKAEILRTFCVSQNPLDRKIKETCGNDKLLEDWLNSKQTRESRQPEKKKYFLDGEWMTKTSICKKYNKGFETVNTFIDMSNGDDSVLNNLLKNYSGKGILKPVHILGVDYRSSTVASKAIGISINTLSKIISKAKTQADIDHMVSNLLAKKQKQNLDSLENRTIDGEDFESIRTMYESNGLKYHADTMYKRYREKDPSYKRSTFIREYSLLQKLKKERVLPISEFDGMSLEVGVLAMARPVGDKVYYGHEAIRAEFDVSGGTVTELFKIRDYNERLRFLNEFLDRNSPLRDFVKKYGKTKKEYAQENQIDVNTLNYLLLKGGDLQENIRLYKAGNVTVLNNVYKSIKSALDFYGLPYRKFSSVRSSIAGNDIDKAFYLTAVYMLTKYFTCSTDRGLNYNTVKYVYSYKDQDYYECRQEGVDPTIRSCTELLTELYGKERVEKLERCIREYKSIYCEV